MRQKIKNPQEKFLANVKSRKIQIIATRIFILIAFLCLWEVSSTIGWIDSFFFSSPSGIIATFITMCKDYSIIIHTGITITETIISFLLVSLIGLSTAMLLWFSKTISEIVEPFLIVLNALPKSALAPLLIVWLGTGYKTIIIAGMSVALFGSIISLYTAFMQIDKDKEKLIYTLGGNKIDILFKVTLPGSLPTILSTTKVNIGLCLVGVVIGEFLAARNGLGYLIIYSSQIFQLDRLILSIFILCILAVGLYQLLNLIERKLVHM